MPRVSSFFSCYDGEKGLAINEALELLMEATGISLKKLTLQYEQQFLFKELTAHFTAGRWHSILGSSGVGKSTLLKVIAGLVDDYQGEILADNQQPLSQRIAWMAQDDLLLPWLNVQDNVALGYRLRQEKPHHLKEQVELLLEKVGLSTLANRMPYQLSGGQRQRVALARTLLEDKPIILMDEPFSALDVAKRLALQTLFVELLSDKTVLFITHDPLEALRLSQSIWLMQGAPAQLEQVVQLESATPRKLDDVEVLHWQNQLLGLMSKGDEYV